MVNPITDNLYQEAVIQHSQNPSHYYELKEATHKAKGYNPVCGDDLTVFVLLVGDQLKKVSFMGDCCAVCKCSASLMTDIIERKNVDQLNSISVLFKDLLNQKDITKDNLKLLGDLILFQGLWKYPARHKCALLPWQAIKGALNNQQQVTTE